MSTETKLTVTEIQRFCMHDGPGIRTTVFLKGCPLSCAWCHNPETQKREREILFYPKKCVACGQCHAVCPRGAHTVTEEHSFDRSVCLRCGECTVECPTAALEICGREMTVSEILGEVQRDAAFYGENGGLTLSGGEPFLHGEAAVALLSAAKARGLHTAVETSGYADPAVLMAAVPYVDLFLWDLKDTDGERHRRYTGVTNERILENLRLVDRLGARVRLRAILVKGVNTETAHYRRLAEIAGTLRSSEGVEFIPYHAYAGTKAVFIGKEDNGRADWIPDGDEILRAKETVRAVGVDVL